MNVLSKLTKVEFRLSDSTTQAIRVSSGQSTSAIAAACVEGAAAQATVREVADAVRAAGWTGDQAAITAGMKAANGGALSIAVEAAINEKYAEKAAKKREATAKKREAAAAAAAANDDAERKLNEVVAKGSQRDILLVKIEIAKTGLVPLADAAERARKAYEKAEAEAQSVRDFIHGLTVELDALIAVDAVDAVGTEG